MKKRILLTICTVIAALAAQAQVTQINSNKSLQFTYPLNSSKSIFVSNIDNHLWATDGTLAGTIELSTTISYAGNLGSTVFLNGKFIFSGTTAATGAELYITDGTPAGTMLVKDIYPGTTGSLPDADGALLNGFIYFTAETPAEGRELWRTDGSTAGTTFVKDIVPGVGGSNYTDAYHIFSTGTYLLFMARTPASGVELWTSDGSSAGTVLLKDINTGVDSSGVQLFYLFNNLVLFSANNGVNGNEIWKSDGTAAGTVLLKDINPGSGSSTTLDMFGFSFSIFQSFHIFKNRAYFNANDGTSTGQVWSTDGTAANTTLLKNVLPGTTLSFVLLLDAVNLPNKFIFPVSDGTTRSELWESDGTPGGTVLFKSYLAGSIPVIFVPYSANYTTGSLTQDLFQGNKFFFSAATSAEGNELWVSDGILANTHIVKDINTGMADGIESANISYLYTTAGLYFAANNTTNGNELWKSDGTAAGTTIVADIFTGTGSADPNLNFFLVNSKILFEATNGDNVATDLYAVDGTFIPLAVKLTDFTVQAQSADALIQWHTSAEINSKDFTIQRSFDGVHFDNIATVAAAGNSSVSHGYMFTDAGIINSNRGIAYYRLLSAEIGGKTEYSKTITLLLKGGQWNVRLLGNPVLGDISLIVTGGGNDVQVTVNDLSGKTVYSNKLLRVNAPVSIPATSLPHGFYVLVVTNGNEKKSIGFIK